MEREQEDASIVSSESEVSSISLHGKSAVAVASGDQVGQGTMQSQSFGSRCRISNPLEINTVVRGVFGCLKYDLKACRLVNKMWNEEAEPFFKKRSRVIFSLFNNVGERVPQTPKTFLDAFAGSESAVKFTSFCITTGNGYPITEMANFFEIQKTVIKDLEIGGLVLFDEDGQDVKTFDISPWIKESQITKFRISGAPRVTLCDREFYHQALVTVPIHHLKYVQNLDVDGHQIEIPQGVRITPKKLDLGNVTVLQNGSRLTEFVINDFININEDTVMDYGYAQSPSTTFILDFGKYFTAKKIHLKRNAKFKNWRVSTCSINHLQLDHVSVFERSKMKIKKLEVSTAAIDLVDLPKDVEMLRLFLQVTGVVEPAITCSGQLLLPKLKFLMIDAWHSAGLVHFGNCFNLVEVCIHCIGGDTPFNLNFLPKSVKKLTMHGYITLEGQTNVEILFVHSSTLRNAENILSKINTKTLHLHLDETRKHKLENKLIPFMLQHSEVDVLSIGPILRYFTKLSEYVDKESEFYVFDKLKGRAIHRLEFFRSDRYPF